MLIPFGASLILRRVALRSARNPVPWTSNIVVEGRLIVSGEIVWSTAGSAGAASSSAFVAAAGAGVGMGAGAAVSAAIVVGGGSVGRGVSARVVEATTAGAGSFSARCVGSGVGAASSRPGFGDLPAGGATTTGVAGVDGAAAGWVVGGGVAGFGAEATGVPELGGCSQNHTPPATSTTTTIAARARGVLLRDGAGARPPPPRRAAGGGELERSAARAAGRPETLAPDERSVRTTWRRYERSFGRQSGPFSRQPMIASVRSRGTSDRMSPSAVVRSPADGLRPASIS